MKPPPQAVLDLVEIWSYIKEHSTPATANRVESVILEESRVPGPNARSRTQAAEPNE